MPTSAEVIFLISLAFVLALFKPLGRCATAGICGFLLVFLAASYHQTKRLAPELWQVPQEIQISVEAHSLVSSYAHQYRVHSRLLNQSFQLSHYVIPQALRPGACYELTVKLKPRHALGNPNTAHHAKNQWVNREFIQGYIDNKKEIRPIPCEVTWFSLTEFRQKIKQFIDHADLSETANTMITALVLGEREGLTDQNWDILQKTGTAHLLAISGLHIGLVYAGVLWLLQWALRPMSLIFLRMNLLILASTCALIASGLYVLISGSGVSSLRAWGMLCVITLLLVRRSQLHALQILLWVVAFILLTDPLAGMGMGLWLSAGAVFALIWLNANQWQVHWKLPLLMLPMSSVWLKSAWLGPIANLVAIPFVSMLIVPAALLAVIMSVINIPGAQELFWATGWLVDRLWRFLTWLSHYAVMHHWSLLTLLDQLMLTGLVGCLLLPWRFIGPIPFILLMGALSWPKPIYPEPHTLLLHVIDAGQGTALLVQVGDKNLLFDAGSPMVSDYLDYYRIRHLDVLVISHNDKDHRAGLADLLQNISVGTLYSGELLPEVAPEQQVACRAGQSWHWEEASFQFLAPIDLNGQGNNASCVLKITLGEQSILFTGDIERKIEQELIRFFPPETLSSTLLVAPHHGSKTSSSYEFIEAVSPEIVIYPTGFLNSYHHPHPDIVARYTHLGSKQFNTAQEGALRVKLSKFGIESINCYTQEHPRWWAMNKEATCSGYLAQAGH
jgi:competence protein ComEC